LAADVRARWPNAATRSAGPATARSTNGKYPIRYLALAEAGSLKKSTAKAKAMKFRPMVRSSHQPLAPSARCRRPTENSASKYVQSVAMPKKMNVPRGGAWPM